MSLTTRPIRDLTTVSDDRYIGIDEEVPKTADSNVVTIRLLWEFRAFIFRFLLIGLLGGIAVAFAISARYESTTSLMPPDSESTGLNTASLAAAAAAVSNASSGLQGLAGSLLGLKSTSDLFVGILGSKTSQDKLIEEFNLRRVYHDRRIEDARQDLSKYTSISVDRKSQIISITVTDKSPQRAAAMAQAYVEELNYLVTSLSTSSARRERIFLEERLRSVSKDLETAEKDFGQFASKNTAIDIKEQGKAMVDAAAVLQGQLIASQSELEGLRQIYSDDNARVRSMRARVNELQRQLEKLGGKGEEESSSTSTQEGGSFYPSIRKLPLLGVQFADLYRRTAVQEAVFETLTKQYEVAKVQEAKEIPTVKILDVPKVPEKRSGPPRILISVIGTALGLIAGIFWIIGRDKWQKIDNGDPGKILAREVLLVCKSGVPFLTSSSSGEHQPAGSTRQGEERS